MSAGSKTILFLLLILMIFFMLSFSFAGRDALPESRHFTLEKPAEGVYAAIHNDLGGFAICKAGNIDLGDRTVILDPFICPTAARDLKRQAEFLTGRPVSLVLNLDPHSDPIGGNQVFIPGAVIISTANARAYIETHFQKDLDTQKETVPGELKIVQDRLIRASGIERFELALRESEYKALVDAFPEIEMTLPDMTIEGPMTIHGSKRNIVLVPVGRGHTTGDMIVSLPGDRIVFMSDELFVKRHPYLGDGDPESLLSSLKRILDLNPRPSPCRDTVPSEGRIRYER